MWKWRLSDGHPLKRYPTDTGEPILQVAPFNDATYFCSASRRKLFEVLLFECFLASLVVYLLFSIAIPSGQRECSDCLAPPASAWS